MTTDPDWLRINRANWDSRVPVHAASRFYDLPGFGKGGVSTLRPYELDEVGDVSGKRLLHLQCHMGQDTLSWARRGVDVTGLDFSAPAIRHADELARSTGLKDRARFVVADVYDAPTALRGQRFDVVYTGLGALVWLPDLVSWAEVVSSLLRDGGFLYLAEFHPVGDLMGEDGRTVEYDYFQPEGQTYDNPHSYTDGPELGSGVSVQWQHPLGDVVSALAAAGLRIEFLHEREFTLFRRYRALEGVPGGYGFPAGRPRLPLMYSVRARKTA